MLLYNPSISNVVIRLSGAELFNQPIHLWDVSSVTVMSSMFAGALVFDQPIGRWNVSQVTRMDGMLSEMNEFNQPLNSWDVSSVTVMNEMFMCTSQRLCWTLDLGFILVPDVFCPVFFCSESKVQPVLE